MPSPQTPAAPHQGAGRNLQHSRTAQQANSRNAPANNPGWQTGGNSLLAAVGFAVPEGLPAVNKGAKIAIYAYIVSMAAPFLLMFVSFLVPGAGLLSYFVAAACLVVVLVGYFCCLQVPAESKAGPLIMAACFCALAGTLGGLVLNAVIFFLPMMLSIFISVLFQSALLTVSFASFGLFLLFIRRVANWLKQSNVAQEAMLNIYLLAACAIIAIAAQGLLTFTMAKSWSVVKNAAPSARQGQQLMEQLSMANEPMNSENIDSLMEQAQGFSRQAASMNSVGGNNAIYTISIVLAGVGLVLTLVLIIRLIILMDLIDFRLPTKSHGAGSYRPGRNAGR